MVDEETPAEFQGRTRRLQQGYGDRKVALTEIEEAIDLSFSCGA